MPHRFITHWTTGTSLPMDDNTQVLRTLFDSSCPWCYKLSELEAWGKHVLVVGLPRVPQYVLTESICLSLCAHITEISPQLHVDLPSHDSVEPKVSHVVTYNPYPCVISHASFSITFSRPELLARSPYKFPQQWRKH